MSTNREKLNALAFMETIVSAGGFRLRPPGYFTANATQILGLKLGQGPEACEALTADEMKEQIHTYLFIQAAPEDTVSRAVRFFERSISPREKGVEPMSREAAWDEFLARFVDPFLMQIPPEGIAAAYEQIAQMDETEAALVTAEPPPDFKGERPDPKS